MTRRMPLASPSPRSTVNECGEQCDETERMAFSGLSAKPVKIYNLGTISKSALFVYGILRLTVKNEMRFKVRASVL